MKKETHNKVKKTQLFVAVSLLLVSVLFLFKGSGITGHFSADFKSQILDMDIDQSQSFLMGAETDEPIHLSSFRVSGEVFGDGNVEIFIDNKQGQKILVYKNIRKKEQGLPGITGMAVGTEGVIEEEEVTLITLQPLGNIGWSKPGMFLSADEEYTDGVFSNKCFETCFIEMPLSRDNTYELIFNIEPETRLKLTKVTYTLKDESI